MNPSNKKIKSQWNTWITVQWWIFIARNCSFLTVIFYQIYCFFHIPRKSQNMAVSRQCQEEGGDGGGNFISMCETRARPIKNYSKIQPIDGSYSARQKGRGWFWISRGRWFSVVARVQLLWGDKKISQFSHLQFFSLRTLVMWKYKRTNKGLARLDY